VFLNYAPFLTELKGCARNRFALSSCWRIRDGYALKFAGTSSDYKSPAIKWLWMHGRVGHTAPLAKGLLKLYRAPSSRKGVNDGRADISNSPPYMARTFRSMETVRKHLNWLTDKTGDAVSI
jgi:hypothetical protein